MESWPISFMLPSKAAATAEKLHFCILALSVNSTLKI